jgi:hypothetical protein
LPLLLGGGCRLPLLFGGGCGRLPLLPDVGRGGAAGGLGRFVVMSLLKLKPPLLGAEGAERGAAGRDMPPPPRGAPPPPPPRGAACATVIEAMLNIVALASARMKARLI